MEESTRRFQGVNQGTLENVLGRIAIVNELDGRPIGTYDVLLDDDRLIRNVPQLLPSASHLLVRGKRVQGGSGILPIAQVGDMCLVTWVRGPIGLAQPFVLGFFSPRRDGKGGDQRNEKRVVPGSLALLTPYGNGVVLHNGGVVEVLAEEGCKRTMTPSLPDLTDGMQAAISDLCRNYRLRTAAGEMTLSEVGDGRTAYRLRINEFSPYGQNSALRRARSAASVGVARFASGSDATSAADASAEAGEEMVADRYVEVVYGSAPGGGLYEEKFVGGRSVTLYCDGDGTYRREADAALEDEVGAIKVTLLADGTRQEVGIEANMIYSGKVSYTTPLFEVLSPLARFSGIVRIGEGGLPSSRIGDLVIVGDRVGTIITGQPNLLH